MASALLDSSGADRRLATNSRSAAILLEWLAVTRCPAEEGLADIQTWFKAVPEYISRPDEAGQGTAERLVSIR